MPREGCWVAEGLLAESSGSDLPWDRGQDSLFLLGFSCECLQLFSALHPQCPFPTHYCTEQFCIPPIVKNPSKCCKVSRAEVQEVHAAAVSWEVSGKQKVSVNAAGINKPSCFLLQSEDKGRVCSARWYSQALQGRQKMMWKFSYFVLDLIPWNGVHMRVFHRKKHHQKLEMQNKNTWKWSTPVQ